jgi:hypothetical protein
MTKAKDLQFAKTLAKYKGTWVALKDSRIIASGEDVEKVQQWLGQNQAAIAP